VKETEERKREREKKKRKGNGAPRREIWEMVERWGLFEPIAAAWGSDLCNLQHF
jgi:hypothetical protein